MLTYPRPLGFLAGLKALTAERLIGQTERLVSSFQATEVDLRVVREALQTAKALHAAEEYSKAVRQARRAAAIAAVVTERFNGYLAAWKALQACREELEELGFPSDGLETALAAADKEVVRTVAEDGTLIPNYAGATALLEQAMGDAHTLVARARRASREIFLATLAVEALSDSPTARVPSWLSVRLEGTVEQATRELALGHAPEARTLAAEARVLADDALAGMARAWELVDMAAAILDGLAAEGPAAASLTERVESARNALQRGFLDRTTVSELARRLSDDVAAFAKHYPRSRRSLERVERVYARFQEDGFHSDDADVILFEARRALEAGDWLRVHATLGRASASLVHLRQQQESMMQSIAEIDERVTLLKGFRLPLLAEVELILRRAKEEVRAGRLLWAGEDLRMANSLMMQATRTGS